MKKLVYTIALVCIACAAFAQETQNREVSGFTAINASSMFNITLAKGDTESLTITADEELLPYIYSEVKNGTLKLWIKDSFKKYSNFKSPKVQIAIKNLTSVELSGACRLECDDVFEPVFFKAELSGASNLNMKKIRTSGEFLLELSGASKAVMDISAKNAEIEISGAGSLKSDIQASSIEFDVSGASSVNVTGLAERASFNACGASSIKAFDLIVKKAEVNLSGTSKAEVNVPDELSVEVSGMSTVHYKGNPTFKSIETSGMSKIKKAEK